MKRRGSCDLKVPRIVIQEHVYKQSFSLIVNVSAEKFNAAMKVAHPTAGVEGEVTDRENCLICVSEPSGEYLYVYVRHFSFSPEHLAILAHELLHVAQYTLKVCKVSLSWESREPIAYLFQSLYESALLALKSHRRSK